MDKKTHYIQLNGERIPVTEQVYKDYRKMKRREKYLCEVDFEQGTFSYNALDTHEFSGEEIVVDRSESVEELVIHKITMDRLYVCMEVLTEDERKLLCELFWEAKSERELAKETGIPRMTICSRKNRIIEKLKKLMKN